MTPLKYDIDGRVVVDDTKPVVAWANGLPLTEDGALAVIALANVTGFANGVPFSEDAKVVTNG